MRNRAGNFSVGRLTEFLTALRRDVEITVRPNRKHHVAPRRLCRISEGGSGPARRMLLSRLESGSLGECVDAGPERDSPRTPA